MCFGGGSSLTLLSKRTTEGDLLNDGTRLETITGKGCYYLLKGITVQEYV